MIYFLAEFCLNSLNGTYFQSVERLNSSKAEHSKLAPFVALYVLIVGFNTINISVIFCQLLFLYSIFRTIDEVFIKVVTNLIIRDKTEDSLFFKVIKNIPFVPVFIAANLNTAYITDSNKCVSLLSRILYTLSHHVSNMLSSEEIIVKIFEFAFSYFVNSIFSKFYLASQLKTTALIFSFSGAYFFLKTHGKSDYFELFNDREFQFSFDLFTLPSLHVVESCLAFLILFTSSFISQVMIRFLVCRVSRKSKRE